MPLQRPSKKIPAASCWVRGRLRMTTWLGRIPRRESTPASSRSRRGYLFVELVGAEDLYGARQGRKHEHLRCPADQVPKGLADGGLGRGGEVHRGVEIRIVPATPALTGDLDIKRMTRIACWRRR